MKHRNDSLDDAARRNVHLNRRLLLLLGVWPYFEERNDSKPRISQVALIVLHVALLLYVIVPVFLHMFLIEKRAYGMLKVLPTFLYVSMALGKYGNLLCRADLIGRCLRRVKEDWRRATQPRTRASMERHARTGKRLLIVCGLLMYGSGSTYRMVIPFARGSVVNERNVTIRPLPCAGYYFFFDTVATPAYELTYFLQVISGFVTFSVTTASCGLAALLVMHACGQLEILEMLIKDIVDERKLLGGSETPNQRLAVSIEQQTRIRTFMKLVDESLQQIFLIEVLGCALLLCLLGYFIIIEWDNQNSLVACMYMFTFSSITSNIFLFCYIGEQYNLQAEKVATTICVLEWYRLPNETARSIVLVMAMANFRTKITAGSMIELSHRTFGNVMRTAATYCNMLRTVV